MFYHVFVFVLFHINFAVFVYMCVIISFLLGYMHTISNSEYYNLYSVCMHNAKYTCVHVTHANVHTGPKVVFARCTTAHAMARVLLIHATCFHSTGQIIRARQRFHIMPTLCTNSMTVSKAEPPRLQNAYFV